MRKRSIEQLVIMILTNSVVLFLALGLGACDIFLIIPSIRNDLHHPIMANLFLFLTTICLSMFLWCWVYAATVDPGSLKEDLKKRGYYNQIMQGVVPPCLQHLPICTVCSLPKPVGAVHCQDCNECFLRCDHHCAVIGQCVADRNFKAFVLALFWGGIFGIAIALSGITRILIKMDIISMFVGIYCLGIGIGLFFFAFSFMVGDSPPVRVVSAKKGPSLGMIEHVKIIWGTFGKNIFEKITPIQKNVTPLAWGGIEWYDNNLL